MERWTSAIASFGSERSLVTDRDALSGAWVRRELSIEPDLWFEYQDAWWLQSKEYFVDVRTDRDAGTTSAFGGRITIDGPHVTWLHHIHTDPTVTNGDSGEVTFLGPDTIVERGVVDLGGTMYEYTEVWDRGHPTSTSVAMSDRGNGLMVLFGDPISLVGVVTAADGGWVLSRAAPDTSIEPTDAWTVLAGESSVVPSGILRAVAEVVGRRERSGSAAPAEGSWTPIDEEPLQPPTP